MKITNIKQQEKRKDRYSIFIDDTYEFSLSETALLEQKLVRGQELGKEELRSFKKLSVDDKVYGNVLRYLSLRSRSTWEIENYLHRKKVDEPVVQKILTKLTTLGLVNDATFARSWVENRRLLKPVSRRRLVQELKQKRVPEDIIKQALAEDEVNEVETLRELVAKKRRQSKYQTDKLKLMQYLARQGFNYDDIKQVVEES
ncbi:MAG TPA: RecX family transcriptional regulator [Candidatus Saccharimonadales bacterium]|nr:RecX family transcriptional regulator [Candidatus Saccharimonadales bacterium]